MPQKNLQIFNLLKFGTVDSYHKKNRLPPENLSYAQNARQDAGFIKGRKGFTKVFDTELTGGTNIKCLTQYPYNSGGTQTNRTVFYYHGDFYYYSPGDVAPTLITDTWTSDLDTEAVAYNNVLYVTNGTDPFAKISNTIFALVTGAPLATVVETWADKMWAAGVASAPFTLYYSATATASVPANIEDWTTTGASGAELIGKSGKITGLKTFQNTLYIFKEDEIYFIETLDLTGTYPQPVVRLYPVTGGAINQQCVTVVNNDVWFLTKSLQIRSLGLEASYLGQSRTKQISFIIQNYIDQLDPNQSTACMTFYKGIFKLSLRTSGNASNDFIIVWDTINDSYTIDRGPSSQRYAVINGNLYFVSPGTSGQVYQDENGFSDNQSNYSFQVKTRLSDLNRPDVYKRARYVYLRGARSAGVTTVVDLLGEDDEVLETFTVDPPTASEIAGTTVDAQGQWGGGQIGGDILGGSGSIPTPDGPAIYRYNVKFSSNSIDRMFGVGVAAGITGQRIEIEQLQIHYIPLSESYTPSTY